MWFPSLNFPPKAPADSFRVLVTAAAQRADERRAKLVRSIREFDDPSSYPPDGTPALRQPSINRSLISPVHGMLDRKSTRLNSSHLGISYAVFCLKKKKTIIL